MPQSKKNYKPSMNGLKNTDNPLEDHYCHKSERWIENVYNGRSIEGMITVCPDCREEKLKKVLEDKRKEVISDVEE